MIWGSEDLEAPILLGTEPYARYVLGATGGDRNQWEKFGVRESPNRRRRRYNPVSRGTPFAVARKRKS